MSIWLPNSKISLSQYWVFFLDFISKPLCRAVWISLLNHFCSFSFYLRSLLKEKKKKNFVKLKLRILSKSAGAIFFTFSLNWHLCDKIFLIIKNILLSLQVEHFLFLDSASKGKIMLPVTATIKSWCLHPTFLFHFYISF